MVHNNRILLLGPYKPLIGGPSHHVQSIAQYFKKDCQITVVSMWEKGYPLMGHWNEEDIEIYQEKLLYPYTYSLLQALFQTTKRAWKLRNGVDVYHSHGFFYSGIGFLDKKKPLILTVHGYSSLETVSHGRVKPNSIRFKIMRKIEKKVVQRADAIIVVGSKLKNWVVNDLNASENKVFVIPNGIDIEMFKPLCSSYSRNDLRSRLGYSAEDKVILFVKKFTEQSGIRYLLQSILEIHKQHPEVKLLAIGGGPLKVELNEYVLENELKNSVKLLDRVQNEYIVSYLNASDIFVFPSIPLCGTEETFGISLIEAMACSKPCIATNIGGPKEIIENGDNVGILIPPADSNAISKEVIKLLDDPLKSKHIGQNARKYIESKYTIQQSMDKTYSIYQQVLLSYNLQ